MPPIFQQYFPKANVTKLVWAPEFGSTLTLSPEDPLFHRIGNAFISALTDIYGTDHLYNAGNCFVLTPLSQSPQIPSTR